MVKLLFVFMLQMKKISEMYGLDVFTESGDLFGTVKEVFIIQSRVHSWKITSAKQSIRSRVIGNAKGVIVPHSLVKAVGDIIIVYDGALPSYKQEKD